MKRSGLTKAFTLIEIATVVIIIGLIFTVVMVNLHPFQAKTRDTKRLSDISQLQAALEMYKRDEAVYPTIITAGQPLVGGIYGKTYLPQVPVAATTPGNSACAAGAAYTYGVKTDGNYQLAYCLETGAGNVAAGTHCATGGKIDDACVYKLTQKVDPGGTNTITDFTIDDNETKAIILLDDGSHNNTMKYTADSGLTWSDTAVINPSYGNTYIVDVAISPDGVYANFSRDEPTSSGNYQIFRSTNSGASFSFSLLTTANITVGCLAIPSTASVNSLIASFGNPKPIFWERSGSSWNQLSTDETPTVDYLKNCTRLTNGIYSVGGQNVGFFASGYYVFKNRSVDGTNILSFASWTSVKDMKFNPSSGYLYIVGSDAGVIKRHLYTTANTITDTGSPSADWKALALGHDYSYMAAAAKETDASGASVYNIYITTDNGDNWTLYKTITNTIPDSETVLGMIANKGNDTFGIVTSGGVYIAGL